MFRGQHRLHIGWQSHLFCFGWDNLTRSWKNSTRGRSKKGWVHYYSKNGLKYGYTNTISNKMFTYALEHFWKEILQFLLGTEGRKGKGVIFTLFTYLNYMKLVGNISIVSQNNIRYIVGGQLWSLCVCVWGVTCQYLRCVSSIWPRNTNKKRDRAPISCPVYVFGYFFKKNP